MSKRIFVLLLGCFLLTSVTLSAAPVNITVNNKPVGSNEFFGIHKIINIDSGIDWMLTVAYVQQDTVTWSLPANCYFKNSTYYIAHLHGGLWTTDYYPAGAPDGQVDFQPISGGLNNSYITFRVTPSAIGITGNAPAEAAGDKWRLVTSVIPAPGVAGLTTQDDILIDCPMQTVQGTPGAWSTGTDLNISTTASTFVTGVPYDFSGYAAFLTVYDEYRVLMSGVADTSDRTINAAAPSLRTLFLGAPTTTSTQPFRLERNPIFSVTNVMLDPAGGPYRDPTTCWQLVAGDIFLVTAGQLGANYTGLLSPGGVSLLLPPLATPAARTVLGPPTTFSIQGSTDVNNGGLFGPSVNANNSVTYTVDGSTVLDDRTFDFAFDFVPKNAVAAQVFNGYEYAKVSQAWIWKNNGTLFRTEWATSGTSMGYNTALRIGNYGTVPAPVYADIWMDDGQAPVYNVLLTAAPGILPNSFLSINFEQICAMAKLQFPTFMYDNMWPSQHSKGRMRILVQAAQEAIGAYEQYSSPAGITSIIMEKWVGLGPIGFWNW